VDSAPVVVHRPSQSGGLRVTLHRHGRDEILRLARSDHDLVVFLQAAGVIDPDTVLDDSLRCAGFMSARACRSQLSGRAMCLLVVGWEPGRATDTAVVLRDRSTVMGWDTPSWLSATKTAHRSSALRGGPAGVVHVLPADAGVFRSPLSASAPDTTAWVPGDVSLAPELFA
jgi:hypothetical protein